MIALRETARAVGDCEVTARKEVIEHRSCSGFRPEFSIIVCSYFEEQSIDEFYTRLSGTLESLGRSYEIVMVNDGSTDRTFENCRRFQRVPTRKSPDEPCRNA